MAAGRGLLSLAAVVALALSGDASGLGAADATSATVVTTAAVAAVVGLLDLYLARAVVRGSTWAWVLLLLDSTVLILDPPMRPARLQPTPGG